MPPITTTGAKNIRASRNSATSQSQSLTEEEKAKLKKILKALTKGIDEQEEEDEFLALVDDQWVDPTPNLVEGIFRVPQTNICLRCCTNRRSKKEDKIFVFD